MIHFKYESILTSISDKYLPYEELFEKYYKEDSEWLKENDIQYQISVFFWPEMPFFTNHQIAMVRSEFEVVISSRENAVLFRLYSGLSWE